MKWWLVCLKIIHEFLQKVIWCVWAHCISKISLLPWSQFLTRHRFFQFFCLYPTLEKLIKRAEVRQVKKTKKQDRKYWDTVDHQVIDRSIICGKYHNQFVIIYYTDIHSEILWMFYVLCNLLEDSMFSCKILIYL